MPGEKWDHFRELEIYRISPTTPVKTTDKPIRRDKGNAMSARGHSTAWQGRVQGLRDGSLPSSPLDPLSPSASADHYLHLLCGGNSDQVWWASLSLPPFTTTFPAFLKRRDSLPVTGKTPLLHGISSFPVFPMACAPRLPFPDVSVTLAGLTSLRLVNVFYFPYVCPNVPPVFLPLLITKPSVLNPGLCFTVSQKRSSRRSPGLFSVLVLSALSSGCPCWLFPSVLEPPWSLRLPSLTIDFTMLHTLFFLSYSFKQVLLSVFLDPVVPLSVLSVGELISILSTFCKWFPKLFPTLTSLLSQHLNFQLPATCLHIPQTI